MDDQPHIRPRVKLDAWKLADETAQHFEMDDEVLAWALGAVVIRERSAIMGRRRAKETKLLREADRGPRAMELKALFEKQNGRG